MATRIEPLNTFEILRVARIESWYEGRIAELLDAGEPEDVAQGLAFRELAVRIVRLKDACPHNRGEWIGGATGSVYRCTDCGRDFEDNPALAWNRVKQGSE